MDKVVYVDNNATTMVAPEVLEEMLPFLQGEYGNPSSMHEFGGRVAKKIREARARVASLLGAGEQEILFTSCGTESDGTAIISTLESYPGKRHIVTTRVEHPAVLGLSKHLAEKGYEVTFVGVNSDGMLNMDELESAVRPDTAVLSVMYANNETGVIFPVEAAGRIAKAKGSVFHVDAVQAVGKIRIDMSRSTIDLLSLSGHKLHGPKGVGALYVRKGTAFAPFLIGGHQEGGRRAGTENVASIAGLGKACELAARHMDAENTRVKLLRDKLEEGLSKKAPGTRINGDRKSRLPNTLNISFEYVEGEAILLQLSSKGIAASSGSACTSGSLEPSHVLRAMGVPFTAAHGSIRFSLSRYNIEEDIDCILRELPPIITRLREISPFGR